ncbi:hypothetical protein AYI69_g740 [Smittium culicis]|uniref:CCHC-type domain-containing protein n=1 Tax=Smittium culicis TaxID=133412 RepID=A0A1R1YS71_9FUNG|nr:hypothetical protein AYI69_g740 [Smittium culicis]
MSQGNLRINTDLFPKKFSGSESDVKIIDIWINRFNTAVALNSIEDSKANDMKAISDTTGWTLAIWMDKLKSKFVKKIDQQGNIFTLLKFKKEGTEDMDTYNNRFRKYVSTIPNDMKTDGLVKKVYSDLLIAIDRDLWWNCSKIEEKSTLETLMKMTSKMMDIKDQAKQIVEESARKEETGTESERKKFQNNVEQLSKEMHQLTLLSQKDKPKRDYSDVTCYTCNKKGHISRVCKSIPTAADPEKKPAVEKKIMIALHEDEKAKVTYGGTASKRPRLDNILNKYPEKRSEPRELAKIANLPHLGSIPKTEKKRLSSNKASPNTEWTKRVLDSLAPISVKEVFNLKPKLIKDFIKSLLMFERSRDKSVLYAEQPKRDSDSGSESENNEESDEDDEGDPLSYLTTYINNEPIPLFLDPGAAYSIISDALLKS